jgi:hypothetical protein
MSALLAAAITGAKRLHERRARFPPIDTVSERRKI